MIGDDDGRMPHSAAAELWLSTAVEPKAHTAANQRASAVRCAWPTA